jgi:hypothetical protein
MEKKMTTQAQKKRRIREDNNNKGRLNRASFFYAKILYSYP